MAPAGLLERFFNEPVELAGGNVLLDLPIPKLGLVSRQPPGELAHLDDFGDRILNLGTPLDST
jgi:hypothetical protein